MLHSIRGKLKKKTKDYIVIEAGFFGFKVYVSKNTIKELPSEEKDVYMFVYFHVRDNDFELYGFNNERSLKLFEMLTSVSGIGPKTALGVLGIDSPDRVIASIVEKKIDFLTKAPGIGQKTAERVILELHRDLNIPKSGEIAQKIDIDDDIVEALYSLGYSKKQAKETVSKMSSESTDIEERLKEALQILSKR